MATAEATPHVPPQNLEAEMSVLGAMMVSVASLDPVFAEVRLSTDDFYRERHRVVYEAIKTLYNRNEAVDALTVTELLTQTGQLDAAGGRAEVQSLPDQVPAPGNSRHYARIVKQNALLRRLLTAAQQIQQSVHGREGEPQELAEHAERLLFDAAHREQAGDFSHLSEVLEEEVDRLEKLAQGDASVTGVPSGFAELDSITGGFQGGNLIVIAARPGMGKCLAGWSLIDDPVSGEARELRNVVEAVERGEDAWVSSLGKDGQLCTARVAAAFRNGRKRVYRITTRAGRSVDATANHPFLLEDGWMELQGLRLGDRIAVPSRPLAERRPRVVDAVRVAVGTSSSFCEFRPREEDGGTSVSWDEIVSITSVGVEETFDLTVPDHHNFVADDVVVHNSGMVINIADHLAREKGKAVAMFSLEMSEMEIAQRLIASRARISSDKLRKGAVAKQDWTRVLKAGGELEKSRLWIDDSSDLGMLDLRAKARRLHASESAGEGEGLACVIVDYLQLMRPEDMRSSRTEQVGQMSRGLKILARELEIPVIALSQLSRAPEQRPGDSRPILSDLRDSGSIEQDSDLVAFIYRDDYYDKESEDQGIAELIVRKNRHGPTDTVRLAFNERFASFSNLAKEDRQGFRRSEEEEPVLMDVAEEG